MGAEDKWILLAHDEAMYEIINSTSGRRLFAQEGRHGRSGVGATTGWKDVADQKWWLGAQGDGTYAIVNAESFRS